MPRVLADPLWEQIYHDLLSFYHKTLINVTIRTLFVNSYHYPYSGNNLYIEKDGKK